MAGNNTLQEKVSGMYVFRDKRTGQSFVHLNDIRLALSRKMTEPNISYQEQKSNPGGRSDRTAGRAAGTEGQPRSS